MDNLISGFQNLNVFEKDTHDFNLFIRNLNHCEYITNNKQNISEEFLLEFICENENYVNNYLNSCWGNEIPFLKNIMESFLNSKNTHSVYTRIDMLHDIYNIMKDILNYTGETSVFDNDNIFESYEPYEPYDTDDDPDCDYDYDY